MARPSGTAGDFSVHPKSGLMVDDAVDPVLAIQQGPITFEAWIKMEQLGGWLDFIRYGISYKAGFSNNNFVFTFLAIEDVISDFAVEEDGEWHHVAMAWEPGTTSVELTVLLSPMVMGTVLLLV